MSEEPEIIEHEPQEVAPHAESRAVAVVSDETNAILSVIKEVALNPDADIAKLEKMIDLQERILNRNAKQAFTAAFAKMQAELPEIEEKGRVAVTKGGTTVPYATFEDINAQVKPILQRYGFGISFKYKQQGDFILITGILSHEEGHSEENEMLLPYDTTGSKNSVQAIGSSASYGKRFVMSALLNISTRGQDDDGRAGGGEKAVIEFQAETLKQTLMACSEETKEWFAEKYGSVDKVPGKDFTQVLTVLQIARDKYEKKAKKEGVQS